MIENTLHNDYRFFISYPNEGQVQVYPVNRTLEFQWSRDDDFRYYRKELSTSLVFTNDQRNNVNDFDAIYGHDRNLDSCEPLPLQIQRYCNEEWILFFEGELHVVDMDFNPEACRVECPVRTLDEWTCVLDQIKEEKNAIPLNRYTAKVLKGQLQTKVLVCGRLELPACSGLIQTPLTSGYNELTLMNDSVNLSEGWTLLKHNGQAAAGSSEKRTTWIRETISATSSPGIDWIDVGGDTWVRSVDVVKVSEIIETNLYDVVYETVFTSQGLEHGMRLEDVVLKMFDGCDVDIISDFYDINADNTAPSNEFYDRAADELQNIFVYQKTDIKRPNADSPASRLPLTIEALLTHMKLVHNVYPFFDDSGNLRLEHISYRDNTYMLDLTQDSLKKYIRGKHQYTYDVDTLPKKERWRWMDDFVDIDFSGEPISYSGCFTSRDNDEVDFAMNYLTTDLVSIRSNPDAAEDDGMVWVACDSNDFVLFDEALLSGEIKINAPLALANLLPHYHTVGRPQTLGNVNGEATQLIAEPVREQPSIKVKLCCEDIATFDPNDKVKTQLGWGRVEDATLVVPYGSLELNLKHHA
jgi:hypothetical protein